MPDSASQVVVGDRGLTVRGRALRAASGTSPDIGEPLEELAEDGARAEPARERRHRDRRVLGEQLDDGVDVVALPRGHVARRRAPRARRRRATRSVACWLRSGSFWSSVARARCSALLTLATVVSSVVRDLLGRVAEHLAQDQHGALARREVLERGDERELDALAQLVARLGPGEPVLQAELLVRVRLDPDGLRQRHARAVVGIGGRPEVDRQHPLGAPPDHVERRVRGDPVEPRAQRAAALEAGRGPSRRAAGRPAARPRRRAPSRASGSSARAARRGTGRRAAVGASRRRRGPRRGACRDSVAPTAMPGAR